jgi:hypothetical protein
MIGPPTRERRPGRGGASLSYSKPAADRRAKPNSPVALSQASRLYTSTACERVAAIGFSVRSAEAIQPPQPAIIASDWRGLERNTLRGVVTLALVNGLVLRERSVHSQGDRRWVGLPLAAVDRLRPSCGMTGSAGHRALSTPAVRDEAMIAVTLRPLPDTRTPERGCRWLAETVIGSERFEAVRRNGAAYELARVLVAAGIEDQPVEVCQEGPRGYALRWHSLRRMAQFEIRESATEPVKLIRYRGMPLARWVKGKTGGIPPESASEAPATIATAFSPPTHQGLRHACRAGQCIGIPDPTGVPQVITLSAIGAVAAPAATDLRGYGLVPIPLGRRRWQHAVDPLLHKLAVAAATFDYSRNERSGFRDPNRWRHPWQARPGTTERDEGAL